MYLRSQVRDRPLVLEAHVPTHSHREAIVLLSFALTYARLPDTHLAH